jgi:hypothetical protein
MKTMEREKPRKRPPHPTKTNSLVKQGQAAGHARFGGARRHRHGGRRAGGRRDCGRRRGRGRGRSSGRAVRQRLAQARQPRGRVRGAARAGAVVGLGGRAAGGRLRKQGRGGRVRRGRRVGRQGRRRARVGRQRRRADGRRRIGLSVFVFVCGFFFREQPGRGFRPGDTALFWSQTRVRDGRGRPRERGGRKERMGAWGWRCRVGKFQCQL